MASPTATATPLSAAFPHHDTHTDSLVSVPLTEPAIDSPHTPGPVHSEQETDDEVGNI